MCTIQTNLNCTAPDRLDEGQGAGYLRTNVTRMIARAAALRGLVLRGGRRSASEVQDDGPLHGGRVGDAAAEHPMAVVPQVAHEGAPPRMLAPGAYAVQAVRDPEELGRAVGTGVTQHDPIDARRLVVEVPRDESSTGGLQRKRSARYLGTGICPRLPPAGVENGVVHHDPPGAPDPVRVLARGSAREAALGGGRVELDAADDGAVGCGRRGLRRGRSDSYQHESR